MSAEPPAPRVRDALAILIAGLLIAAAILVLRWPEDTGKLEPLLPAELSLSATSSPIAVPFIAADRLRELAAATTDTTLAPGPRDPDREAGTDGVVVHNRQPVAVFDTPGGSAIAQLPQQQLGADTWLPVISEQPGWVEVLLPSRPNGSVGWLARSGLEVARSSYDISIDLSQARLQLNQHGRPAAGWPVSVGGPGTPTPTGRTFLLASIRDPQQRFSPLILALGAHSNTLERYAGGPGTVGIHTWPVASGAQASHGCIRVPQAALRSLQRVPLGSLIRITA